MKCHNHHHNHHHCTISFSFSILCFNAYGFDLKSLTDKIQKDLGDKLQVPKGNNSNNPLGGMLKNLNQNNKNLNSSAIGTNVSSINTSNNQINAKRVCGKTIPKTLKNLPKGNVNDLLKGYLNLSFNMTLES